MRLFSMSKVSAFCFSRQFIGQATANLSISVGNPPHALTQTNPFTQPATHVVIHHHFSSRYSTGSYLDRVLVMQKSSMGHGLIRSSTFHGGKRISLNSMPNGQVSRSMYVCRFFFFILLYFRRLIFCTCGVVDRPARSECQSLGYSGTWRWWWRRP